MIKHSVIGLISNTIIGIVRDEYILISSAKCVGIVVNGIEIMPQLIYKAYERVDICEKK